MRNYKYAWRFGFNDFEIADSLYEIGCHVGSYIYQMNEKIINMNDILNTVRLKQDENLIYIETPKWKTNYFNTLGVLKVEGVSIDSDGYGTWSKEYDITKQDFEKLKFGIFDELKLLLMD